MQQERNHVLAVVQDSYVGVDVYIYMIYICVCVCAHE